MEIEQVNKENKYCITVTGEEMWLIYNAMGCDDLNKKQWHLWEELYDYLNYKRYGTNNPKNNNE